MSRSAVVMVIILIVLIGGTAAISYHLDVRRDNPAVQRRECRKALEIYSGAIRAYADDTGAWPADLKALWAWPRFTGVTGLRVPDKITRARRIIRVERARAKYYYRAPEEGAPPETVVIAPARPLPGVAQGEPFGEKGQVAKTDIPPVWYGVTAALELVEMDEAEWRKRGAWALVEAER